MKLSWQRRAQIQFRSLEKGDQNKISRALDIINLSAPSDLLKNKEFHRLHVESDNNLYAYQGSPKYRVVLSFQGEICVVEDIFAHDRFNQFISNWKHQ